MFFCPSNAFFPDILLLRNSNVGVAKTIVLYDKTDKENYGFNGMDGLDPARNRLDS